MNFLIKQAKKRSPDDVSTGCESRIDAACTRGLIESVQEKKFFFPNHFTCLRTRLRILI